MTYVKNVGDPHSLQVVRHIFNTWKKELDFLDAEAIKIFSSNDNYSNISQIIWADTKYVGCGRTFFRNGLFVVCNYGPFGNKGGFSIYNQGEPCSNCSKRCNKFYPGLCGESFIEEWKDQPFPMGSSINRIDEIWIVIGIVLNLINEWKCKYKLLCSSLFGKRIAKLHKILLFRNPIGGDGRTQKRGKKVAVNVCPKNSQRKQ